MTGTTSPIRTELETGQAIAVTMVAPHSVITAVLVLSRNTTNSMKDMAKVLTLRLGRVGLSFLCTRQALVVKSARTHSLTQQNRNLCITPILAALDSESS